MVCFSGAEDIGRLEFWMPPGYRTLPESGQRRLESAKNECVFSRLNSWESVPPPLPRKACGSGQQHPDGSSRCWPSASTQPRQQAQAGDAATLGLAVRLPKQKARKNMASPPKRGFKRLRTHLACHLAPHTVQAPRPITSHSKPHQPNYYADLLSPPSFQVLLHH